LQHQDLAGPSSSVHAHCGKCSGLKVAYAARSVYCRDSVQLQCYFYRPGGAARELSPNLGDGLIGQAAVTLG